jgi:hypothetical protein
VQVRQSQPARASQPFTVWSKLALARQAPSGLKATLVT